MKKLLLILLCFPMIGFGQGFKLDEVGLVFGPSINISKHPIIELIPCERDGLIENLSHSEGLSLRYYITPLLSMSTQFLYKVNRNRFNQTITFTNIVGEVIGTEEAYHISKQKYLNVPLLAEINFKNKKINMSIKFGGYIEYLIASSEEVDGLYSMTTSTLSEMIYQEDFYKKWDFGFMLGSGISYAFKYNVDLSFDILANTGIIDSSTIVLHPSDDKYYNKSITGLFGISYKLKQ